MAGGSLGRTAGSCAFVRGLSGAIAAGQCSRTLSSMRGKMCQKQNGQCRTFACVATHGALTAHNRLGRSCCSQGSGTTVARLRLVGAGS